MSFCKSSGTHITNSQVRGNLWGILSFSQQNGELHTAWFSLVRKHRALWQLLMLWAQGSVYLHSLDLGANPEDFILAFLQWCTESSENVKWSEKKSSMGDYIHCKWFIPGWKLTDPHHGERSVCHGIFLPRKARKHRSKGCLWKKQEALLPQMISASCRFRRIISYNQNEREKEREKTRFWFHDWTVFFPR